MNASPALPRELFLRRPGVHFRKALLGPLFLMLVLMAVSAAHAAPYTVTDTSDDVADTGSLRYALSQVNAGSGGDIISFSGVTGTITLGSTLAINESVTINGPGANLLTVSGNDQVQVFNAAVGTTVTISGLTIANGFLGTGTGQGAGIFSYGANTSLTVNNCTFFNNVANGTAGAVNVGGAIDSSNLTVNNSTFINNSVGGASSHVGGAIYVAVGTINNSTFVGNAAPANGGAIYSEIGSNLRVHNSTIVGNSAATNGGIGSVTAPTVTNSIVSGNTGGDCAKCSATGTNLIGGTAALGPLQYNGGPTETMMPLSSGTGIIGAGLNSTLATDQRGFPRPTSGASDLGSVQTYNLTVTTTADSTDSGTTCTGGATCSLRDAINLANGYGAGDVVTLTGLQGTIALGGGIDNAGTITVSNSIVAGNTETGSPNDDCASCGTQTTFNLTSTASAPITAAQVMLAPLDYYGPNQTVRTMLPIPGSPVMQVGDLTQLPGDLTTDERQLPRTINNKVDLGAVESNYTSIQFVQQPSNTNVNADISPAVTMSVTESGTTAANIPILITFTGAGVLSGTSTETTLVPSGGGPALASFGNLNGNTAGTGDTLTATLTVTPAGVTPAQTLTATSTPFDILALIPTTVTATLNPTAPIYGQPVTITVAVPTTGSVPPTGTVTIYYNGNPIGTGTLGSNGTVIVTLPGGTLPAGTGTITVGYGGDGNYGSSTSAPQQVTVTQPAPPSDSTISSSTGPQTVLPGRNATYTLPVTPVNGAFNSAVTLSATGLPAGATATFNPPTVMPGSGPAVTTMTIQTTKQTAELRQLGSAGSLMLGLLLPLFDLRRGRRKLQRCGLLLLFAVLSIGAVTGLSGCSPGGFFGRSPQTYAVTVTGTSGSLQHSTTVTLTVQ